MTAALVLCEFTVPDPLPEPTCQHCDDTGVVIGAARLTFCDCPEGD